MTKPMTDYHSRNVFRLALPALICASVWAAGNARQSEIQNPKSKMAETDALIIPRIMSYQGKLTDAAGVPVNDSSYAVTFRFFNVPSGGSALWTETQTVATKAGLFSCLLGRVTPIPSVPDAGSLYLEMQISPDPAMTPRVQIASAAYAYKADTANYALASAGAGGSTWVRGTPDSVLYTVNRLGIARGASNNMLYGNFRQSHVNFGVSCTTGASGQDYSNVTVGGGLLNTARAGYSTVAGGWLNRASGVATSVTGGVGNLAGGDYSAVVGGYADTTLALCGGALSGYLNKAGDAASDTCAVVGGGYQNRALDRYTLVGGGYGNAACSLGAVVGGGWGDTAAGRFAGISGGWQNSARGAGAYVGCGAWNSASGYQSVVGGGIGDTASGYESFVAGGEFNHASGQNAGVGGGFFNFASGRAATVPGGFANFAVGYGSLAAGSGAHARHGGSFVWGDSVGYATDTVSTSGSNQWVVRARGGAWFFSNFGMTTGVYLAPGSNSWTSACDSANKEDFRQVDRNALLEKIAALRVRNYKMKDQDDGTRHIGPVAQDFHNAFGVGETEKGINMADADGVALAAIQALYEQVKAQQAEIDALKAELKKK